MPGTLYVVATPIGNLEDLTPRAQATFKDVDAVACEDTRRTEKIMRHLGLKKTLIRYDEHTHRRMAPRLIQDLNQGRSLALVTDAGTPGVSDPGNRLVEAAVEAEIPVVPIPGASAVSAAVSVAGFGGDGYTFLGFLPRRPGRAKRVLQEVLGLGRTVVVFESPYRVKKTLDLIGDLSPSARVMCAREMTKLYEEFIRGDIEHVKQRITEKPPKGEIVLVIQNRNE